jgi:soluble lytic murein transglycosylase
MSAPSVRARRRRLLWLGGIAAVAVAVIALLPTLNHAVRKIVLPLEHADVIRQQAQAKHLDPALIAAVIYAESKFVARTSSAGATGLMQITPETAAFIARRSGATSFTTKDLATPQLNISYGSYYLRYLLDRYHGNVIEALAAYNAGISNVDGWVAQARRDGASFGLRPRAGAVARPRGAGGRIGGDRSLAARIRRPRERHLDRQAAVRPRRDLEGPAVGDADRPHDRQAQP